MQNSAFAEVVVCEHRRPAESSKSKLSRLMLPLGGSAGNAIYMPFGIGWRIVTGSAYRLPQCGFASGYGLFEREGKYLVTPKRSRLPAKASSQADAMATQQWRPEHSSVAGDRIASLARCVQPLLDRQSKKLRRL